MLNNHTLNKVLTSTDEELIVLDGARLSIEEVVLVANMAANVVLCPQAEKRIAESRRTLELCASKGQQIYGMNTHLGPFADKPITDGDIAEIQLRFMLDHAVKLGRELTTREVRAMILTRLNGFAVGTSGIRLETAQRLIQLLNLRITPIVIAGASVGASDLSEMAQIAMVLVGSGEVRFDGQRMPASEALKLVGLPPLVLAGKEGLSLISNNGFSIGVGALLVNELETALTAVTFTSAISLEAFDANLSPLEPIASKKKAHSGHQAVARQIRQLLVGSSLYLKPARNRQDPLSFRCIPSVLGVLHDYVQNLKRTVEIELNSGGDNPLVDIENGEVYSVGNFDTTCLSVGFDAVRIALTTVINMVNERVQKLLCEEHSGVQTGLKLCSRSTAGLIPLGRTVAALTAEANSSMAPVSTMFRSQLGAGIEDFASMAPLSVTRTRDLADILFKVCALEIIIACGALSIRPLKQLGVGTRKIFDFVLEEQFEPTRWQLQFTRVFALLKSGSLSDSTDRDNQVSMFTSKMFKQVEDNDKKELVDSADIANVA